MPASLCAITFPPEHNSKMTSSSLSVRLIQGRRKRRGARPHPPSLVSPRWSQSRKANRESTELDHLTADISMLLYILHNKKAFQLSHGSVDFQHDRGSVQNATPCFRFRPQERTRLAISGLRTPESPGFGRLIRLLGTWRAARPALALFLNDRFVELCLIENTAAETPLITLRVI